MKIKHMLLALVLLGNLLVAVVVFTPSSAQAATSAQTATQEACGKSGAGFLGFPTWYKYLNPTFDPGDPTATPPRPEDCKISFDLQKDIGKVLLAVFEIILRVGGLVAVGFVIFGGFEYIISQGEPDRIKGARSTILNAVIGLAIAVSATAIVNLIAGTITG